jgi:hypothetical protein
MTGIFAKDIRLDFGSPDQSLACKPSVSSCANIGATHRSF